MMDKDLQIRLGVDIGGTFTDLVLIDEERGVVHIAKVLTTPDDPAEGTLSGFRKILESAGLESSGLASIVHATTLITNALIERKGARTGLITTQGFSDVIEIGREKRFDLYDLHQEMPEPLVPEELRAEAPERVHVDGEIVVPLDVEAVKRETERLVGLGSGISSPSPFSMRP